ncbi:Fic family protein [Flavobacterium fluviatile]|uniref:Fic family protein n=1 Tax=Flavobacterium fluviatile TaxID=1862387 RepID=UPI0013D44C96|nr:Fic family protein [Flavobacterium fluviatile]
MKSLLKNGREQKGLKTREVAQILNIDQALISKFENGIRQPTREQVLKLAELLGIDYEKIMTSWLKEKILHEIENEELALMALTAAQEELKYRKSVSKIKLSGALEKILKEIDWLKAKFDTTAQNNFNEILQKTALEYTFESNRIDENTMTLKETEMVINEGLTISGKSMKEHLEAVNHQEAIRYLKDLQQNNSFYERDLLSIHNLIQRGINPESGNYRKIATASDKEPASPDKQLSIPKEIEEYFIWFEINKNKLHPVVLASEMHFRLFKIKPFNHANGKTSRLIMNLILMQKGYPIVNIKGNDENKRQYLKLLENNDSEDFIFFVAQIEKENLERYIKKE